jgi:hypothetical protein
LVLWVFLGFELLRLLVRERERERELLCFVCVPVESVCGEREGEEMGLKRKN